MAYNPTNWKTGDVVTSAKLNNIEAGVSTAQVINVAMGEAEIGGETVSNAILATPTDIGTWMRGGHIVRVFINGNTDIDFSSMFVMNMVQNPQTYQWYMTCLSNEGPVNFVAQDRESYFLFSS